MSDLPGFRWLPGMLADDGHRVVRVVNGVAVRAGGVIGAVVGPDWTDPLTALGLLVLVREAWLDDGIHARAGSDHPDGVPTDWVVYSIASDVLTMPFATETEALKAALAAAPRKP